MLELVTKLNITGTFSNSLKQGLAGMRAAAQEINKAGKTFQRGTSRAAQDMRKSERSSDKIRKNSDKVKRNFSQGALNLGRMGDLFARSVTRLRYSAISLLGGGALAAGVGAATGFTLRQNDQFLQRNIGLASSVASAYGGTFNERFAQAPGLSRELGRMAAVTPGTEAEFSTAFAQLSQIMSGSGLDIARNTQNMLIGGQLSRGAEGRGFIIQDIVSALQEGNINVRQMKDLAFVMRNAYGGDFETKFDSADREGQENLIVDALNKMTDLQEELKNSFEVQLTTVQSLLTAVFLEFTSAFAGKATGLVGGGASILQNNFSTLLAAAQPLGNALALMAPILGGLTLAVGVFLTTAMALVTAVAAFGAIFSVASWPFVAAAVAAAAGLATMSALIFGLAAVITDSFIDPTEEAKKSIESIKNSLTTMVVRVDEAAQGLSALGDGIFQILKESFGGDIMGSLAIGFIYAAASISILTGAIEVLAGVSLGLAQDIKSVYSKVVSGEMFRLDGKGEPSKMPGGFMSYTTGAWLPIKANQILKGLMDRSSNLRATELGPVINGTAPDWSPGGFGNGSTGVMNPAAFDKDIGDQWKRRGLSRIMDAFSGRDLKRLDESAVLEKLMKLGQDVFKNTTNIENVNVEVRAETLEDPQRAALVIDEILAEVVERSMSAGNNAFSGGR